MDREKVVERGRKRLEAKKRDKERQKLKKTESENVIEI